MNNDNKPMIRFVFFVVFGFMVLFPTTFILISTRTIQVYIIPIIMILFFLGVFGGMIRLISKQSIKVKQATPFTENRRCVHCNKIIELEYKYCPDCGGEQTNYIICEYCGHHNDKNRIQCEECNALIK